MKTSARMTILTAITAVHFLCFSMAEAKKPDKPPGGGGGAGAAYTIIPIEPLGMNSVRSGVADLNELTQAVGFAEDAAGASHAVHYDYATGQYTVLAGGSIIGAEGVNDLNQIAGFVGDAGAFWSQPTASPVTLLPLDPTDSLSEVRAGALAINYDGLVLGGSDETFWDANGQELLTIRTAVVWLVTADGDGVAQVQGPVALPTLPGHASTFAGTGCLSESISGAALATGVSYGMDYTEPGEAVTWSIVLNSDGDLIVEDPESRAAAKSAGHGINWFGDVCGRQNERPFLALAGQSVQLLSTPRNTQNGYALDLNDIGEAIGQLDVRRSNQAPRWYAYLWTGGARIDLSSQIDSASGWSRLDQANTINNSGVIGGSGTRDVEQRGFIMIPN